MIGHKFIRFKTRKGFDEAFVDRDTPTTGISNDSIVFIEDERVIWTNGQFYGQTKDEMPKEERSKGLFDSEYELKQAYPSPEKGDWAFAKYDGKYYIYRCSTPGLWERTFDEYKLGMSDEDIQLMFRWFAQDQQTTIDGIHTDIQNLDTKYGNITDGIIASIPDNIITSDNIDDYLPESSLIPEGVITEENIGNYIPDNVITTDTIGDYIPEPLVITIDEELSEMSENPVQNAAIYEALGSKADKSQLNSYATSEQLQSFLTVLGTKASTADLESYAGNVAAVAAGLNQKVNTSYAEETYAKKTDLAQEVADEVSEQVASIQQAAEHSKGYFGSDTELNQTIPNPELGDWAIVSSNGLWIIYRCTTAGTWTTTGEQYTEDPIDLTLYAKLEDLQGLVTAQQLQQHTTAADAKYLTANDLTGYALSSQVDAQYAKKTELTAHSDYAELTYAKKNELLNFLTSEDIQNFITGSELRRYATTQYVDNNVSALQELVQYLYDKYISWHLDDQQGESEPNPYSPLTRNDMVTLTVDEYLELVDTNRVRENTYYFTYIPEVDPNATWGFGDKFPIIFRDTTTNNWTFGGTFPIVFNGILGVGEFPITLD